MNAYKMIAFDIDGTLVNDLKVLSNDTVILLESLNKNGIKVCLSTGRPPIGCLAILDKLSFKPSIIAYNGGSVILEDHKTSLLEKTLPFITVKSIFKLTEDLMISVMVWSKNTLYVLRQNEWVDNYKTISNIEPVLIDSIDELSSLEINKLLLYSTLDKIDLIKTKLSNDSYDFFNSKKDFLEIVPKDVNKGSALELLTNHYDLSKDELIAVGDGDNDISMIDYAGLGIAMNNASEGLKVVADVVVSFTNNEDLLKKYLENLLKML